LKKATKNKKKNIEENSPKKGTKNVMKNIPRNSKKLKKKLEIFEEWEKL